MVGRSTGPGSVAAHRYRGEMERAVDWRKRLDETTDWSVTGTSAIVADAFSGGSPDVASGGSRRNSYPVSAGTTRTDLPPMFDSTTAVVAEHPVTLPPLALALWIGYRVLTRYRDRTRTVASVLAALGIVPLLVAHFLAELTGGPFWTGVADGVVAAEARLIDLAVAAIDAALAAWLRVSLLFLGGLWTAIRETLAGFGPALRGGGFLLTVFGFEFFAGVALIYGLYRSPGRSETDYWLRAVGGVALLTGLFATLVRLDSWRVGEATLTAGLIAAVLGFAAGVTATILVARPNFDREPPADRPGTDSRGLSEGEPSRDGSGERGVVGAAVTRLRRSAPDREE